MHAQVHAPISTRLILYVIITKQFDNTVMYRGNVRQFNDATLA